MYFDFSNWYLRSPRRRHRLAGAVDGSRFSHGASARQVLDVQSNIATTYQKLGRLEEARQIYREVYSGWLKLDGEEHAHSLLAANNYGATLIHLKRFEEARSLLRKTIPVARRVLKESHDITLRIRWSYARALCLDPRATLDDLREAATTLEDAARIARRVMGGAHPLADGIEIHLRLSRAALDARENSA